MTTSIFKAQISTTPHFQKIPLIFSLCNFHYKSEGIPSLICFWWLMTSVLQVLVHVHFPRSKKTAHAKDQVYFGSAALFSKSEVLLTSSTIQARVLHSIAHWPVTIIMLSLHLNLCGQFSKIPFEFMGIPKSIAFSLAFQH